MAGGVPDLRSSSGGADCHQPSVSSASTTAVARLTGSVSKSTLPSLMERSRTRSSSKSVTRWLRPLAPKSTIAFAGSGAPVQRPAAVSHRRTPSPWCEQQRRLRVDVPRMPGCLPARQLAGEQPLTQVLCVAGLVRERPLAAGRRGTVPACTLTRVSSAPTVTRATVANWLCISATRAGSATARRCGSASAGAESPATSSARSCVYTSVQLPTFPRGQAPLEAPEGAELRRKLSRAWCPRTRRPSPRGCVPRGTRPGLNGVPALPGTKPTC